MSNKHSHILFSYSFDLEGKAKKLDNKKVSEELRNEGLSWVHLDANNDSTKKWLQKEVSYLDHIIIDALLAEETGSRVTEFKNGLLIILRSVNLNKDAEPEDMVSIRMWIDDQRIITVQRKKMKALFDVAEAIESEKKIKNAGEFLYNLVYQILFTTSPFLYALTDKLDSLEEKIMNSHELKLREDVLRIRTQSTIFRRYLSPQKEVIRKLSTLECEWIDDWAQRHFKENYDNITHMIEEINEARDRSKILHDELTSSLTEKLNRNMYVLSLITVIFMPLTFFTGLFGVNIGGIPGSESQDAFFTFAFVMILVAAIQIAWFKKKDWF